MSGREKADLWAFAVVTYSQPGVSDACLGLQNDYQVDVNVLLFAAWMGVARGVELTPMDISAQIGVVQPWAEEVVKPLRRVRQLLKAGPAPAPSPETEAARTKLKSIELEMERIELKMLEAVGLKVAASETKSGDPLARLNLGRVVSHYHGKPAAGRAADLVETIVTAAGIAARRSEPNISVHSSKGRLLVISVPPRS